MVGAGVRGVPRKVLCTGSPRLCSLAGGGLGLQGLGAHSQGLEGWEQANCPALPKQCSSMQGLVSTFMIYLKFKSMPGPSARGEGCQEPGRRRGGGREAGLTLCASLALVPEPCTLGRCRAWHS